MTDETPHPLSREEADRLLADCSLHEAIGLRLTAWELGVVRFELRPLGLVRFGHGGVVHGGALAAALDTAACFAVIAAIGRDCSTVDLRTDFLRPATDAVFAVSGEVTRSGRRLAWADAAVRAADGGLIATARGLFGW